MQKVKRFPVATVKVVMYKQGDADSVNIYELNELEFTNLRLEYAQGKWKDYRIQFFNEGNIKSFIRYDGACIPHMPPQFNAIDRCHTDIFFLKYAMPAHWEKAKEEDAEYAKYLEGGN